MKITEKIDNIEKQLPEFFAVEKQTDYSLHLQHTILAVRSSRQTVLHRQRLSFPALVLKQVRFVALKIWLVQGMLLSALCALFLFYYDRGVIRIDEHIPRKALALCAGIIALSTEPLLLRPTRYQMLEVEQSTYFSNRGGILAQLLFIGMGDAGMLTVLTLLAAQHRISTDRIFLFLVIPFLTAATTGLMLWVRIKPSLFHKAWGPVCILTALITCEVTEKTGQVFPDAPLFIWICYALLCVCVLGCEYRRLCFKGSLENML